MSDSMIGLAPISRLRANEDIETRVRLLEQAPLFSVLGRGDLDVLAKKFYAVNYRRGEMIFREGEPAERLFVISDGRVKLTVLAATGSELLVGLVGRGEIFGELAVLDRGPRAMCARAMEPSTVYALGADVLWTMLETHSVLACRLLELMARRLRRADQTTQDLVFFDSTTRLARKLLELAEDHGEPTGTGQQVQIMAQVTQEEIAQMIGVSRGSANRLISGFVASGLLDWNRGSPILLRPESLMRRAR